MSDRRMKRLSLSSSRVNVASEESTAEQVRYMRMAVGLVLLLFGGFSLLVGIGFALFTNKDGPYIGTNGLLVWSLIMMAFGAFMRAYRFEDNIPNSESSGS